MIIILYSSDCFDSAQKMKRDLKEQNVQLVKPMKVNKSFAAPPPLNVQKIVG
jgi:hypothetical protein